MRSALVTEVGTSPRLWGDCLERVSVFKWHRYIPTPVGRLCSCSRILPDRPVHPHACGEIWSFGPTVDHGNGTSPRLWGDCFELKFKTELTRYIPTPVGRLRIHEEDIVSVTVHPHACGEIELTVMISASQNGTSPRLWGDSLDAGLLHDHSRYIPTPVGRFCWKS